MDIEKAINKMMEMCGYNARFHHLLQMGNYPWYSKYTCTLDEELAFRNWFITEHVSKNKKKHGVRYAHQIAAKQYASFWFQYGLRTV